MFKEIYAALMAQGLDWLQALVAEITLIGLGVSAVVCAGSNLMMKIIDKAPKLEKMINTLTEDDTYISSEEE